MNEYATRWIQNGMTCSDWWTEETYLGTTVEDICWTLNCWGVEKFGVYHRATGKLVAGVDW